MKCPNLTFKDAATKKTTTLKPTNKAVNFRTSDNYVFTVDAKGNIKGVYPGTAYLIIEYNSLTVSYKITVK